MEKYLRFHLLGRIRPLAGQMWAPGPMLDTLLFEDHPVIQLLLAMTGLGLRPVTAWLPAAPGSGSEITQGTAEDRLYYEQVSDPQAEISSTAVFEVLRDQTQSISLITGGTNLLSYYHRGCFYLQSPISICDLPLC